jgi:2,4-dichlorophenol 6-monooxygenase
LSTDTFPNRTTVLIIGGGPNGLVASGLLSKVGIDNVVVERRSGTQKAPAAHVLRHRPIEVLSLLGIRDRIREQIPSLSLEFVNWCSTLGGPEIGRLDLRRAQKTDPLDETWVNLSQSLLEPILVEAVSKEPRARVLFGAQCDELLQAPDSVSARIRTQDGGEHEIRASWVIVADGAGSRTRTALGIEMEGAGPLGEFFMVHFRADLRPWIADRPGPLYWILNPEAGGTVIVHDPAKSYVFMTPARGDENEDETIPDRLRQALGVSADLEIVSTDRWVPFNQVATRYREGRAILVGDAAHRFPPTGGLGLNTGILDVHNLVWKLAMVERGQASESLLDRYEEECRPAARTNADVSLQNMVDLGKINAVLGPFEDLATLEKRIATLSPEEREALDAAIDSQFDHFASEGTYPQPVRGADALEPMRWHSPYEQFTIFSTDEDPWREMANELSAQLSLPVGFERLSDADAAAEPTGAGAFLTRPDGIIEWTSSPADATQNVGITRAISDLLGR